MSLQSLEGIVVEVSHVLKYLLSDCFLPKKTAAEYLGWSPRKLETYMNEIKHYRHNTTIYFKRSDLDCYMARFEVQPGPSEAMDIRAMAEQTMAKLKGKLTDD